MDTLEKFLKQENESMSFVLDEDNKKDITLLENFCLKCSDSVFFKNAWKIIIRKLNEKYITDEIFNNLLRTKTVLNELSHFELSYDKLLKIYDADNYNLNALFSAADKILTEDQPARKIIYLINKYNYKFLMVYLIQQPLKKKIFNESIINKEIILCEYIMSEFADNRELIGFTYKYYKFYLGLSKNCPPNKVNHNDALYILSEFIIDNENTENFCTSKIYVKFMEKENRKASKISEALMERVHGGKLSNELSY